MITACVIDASVGIKVLLDEPDTAVAEQLLAAVRDSPAGRLYVPDLFYVECANTLWKYTRRFGYSIEEAQANLTNLKELDLTTVPTSDLLSAALDIGVQHGITVYDSCYVALARLMTAPLISADQKLIQKAQAVIDARLLTDWEF